MKLIKLIVWAVPALWVCSAFPQTAPAPAASDMAAKIRQEGLERSQVMEIAGYMTDVLGARLTLSAHMQRAQVWAKQEMEKLGLVNAVIEPYMDYGVTWDNEYVSLHLLEPDYQPMVGYPLTHTPGTNGKRILPAVLADVQTRSDLEKFKGKLKGAAVLSTPPFPIDLSALARATPRRTAEDLKLLEDGASPTPPRRRGTPPAASNSPRLNAEEKLAFFRAEGALAVLQCESGKLGAVRGFSRPSAGRDQWSRETSLDSLPILAVTPEHYNRMYRILQRGIPVQIELEVRNRLGEQVEQAANVIGEIPGTDLKDQIVMLGAHFDTWQASPNASDDTAGCAVALEAARILIAVGARPRRTIRVALWSGEEQGLFGSRAYIRQHFGNPQDPQVGARPEYEKFSVYFNQDYGAGAFRGIYLQGNERVRSLFAAWMEPFRELGCTAISIRGVGSTDHVSFNDVGLPGFQFIQDRVPGTAGHTNLDFFDTLPAEDLIKNATIMAAFVYEAAMLDERIPRMPLKTTK